MPRSTRCPRRARSLDRIRAALRAHLRVVAEQLDIATVFVREWRYLEGERREQFVAERRRYEERHPRASSAKAARCGELRTDLDDAHGRAARALGGELGVHLAPPRRGHRRARRPLHRAAARRHARLRLAPVTRLGLRRLGLRAACLHRQCGRMHVVSSSIRSPRASREAKLAAVEAELGRVAELTVVKTRASAPRDRARPRRLRRRLRGGRRLLRRRRLQRGAERARRRRADRVPAGRRHERPAARARPAGGSRRRGAPARRRARAGPHAPDHASAA